MLLTMSSLQAAAQPRITDEARLRAELDGTSEAENAAEESPVDQKEA